jgi:putative hemolysin
VQTDLGLWLLVWIAVALYGLAIAAELTIPNSGRGEIRSRNEDNSRQAAAIEQLVRDPGMLLISLQVLRTMALVVIGAATARLLPETLPVLQVLAAALLVGILVLMGQAVQRHWVLARAGAVAWTIAPITLFFTHVLWPVSALVRKLSGRSNLSAEELLSDNVLLSENGLRLLLNMGENDDPILESEKEMIASILEMDDTAAREVMVPRIDVVALNVETTFQGALDVILEAGHSRIPVYEDNIDKIVGMLYAKDLLLCFRENRIDTSIRDLLRPTYFVPVSKKVNILLRDMQKHRVHIAVVVDEYGGTAGLVTIEDILEEIVGEIQDEYDAEEDVHVEIVGPDAYLLNSRLDIYSLSKLLDTELPNEDADTLGGLIYSILGHVPEQGEAVEVHGWQFTVLSIEGNRIDQVRADKLSDSEGDEVADDERVTHARSNGSDLPATDGNHPLSIPDSQAENR